MSWLSTKRIFHNDDRHETSQKWTREHLVVIKTWKWIQKFIFAIKKVFVENPQNICASILEWQQLWSQRWQGQNFFWLMLHFISNFLDLLTVCEYQIITASLELDTNNLRIKLDGINRFIIHFPSYDHAIMHNWIVKYW